MQPKSRPPLSVIGRQEIKLQNRSVSYTLKQSARIRAIRLEIRSESGLTVVVPKRYSRRQLNDILVKKSGWILRHLPATKPLQMPLFIKEVDHGEKISFMGGTLDLAIAADDGKHMTPFLKGRTLFIPRGSVVKSRAEMLEGWYREQAARIFKEKADRFQKIMGVRYSRITIRGQRKRWASASPMGNLSINWKLLLAPETIIDYVIVHELAHFKHMDHSRKFWDYLARYCPKWRENRKWLLDHEDDLKARASFGR
ncbi:MAG: SprT family zinc-dependent metalloprotease [Dehalococcoidia bacterium]